MPEVLRKRDIWMRVVAAAEKLGADPHFIVFVLAYDGVVSTRVRRLDGLSPVERRRLYRRVKREEPDGPAMWAMIKAELKRRRQLHQRETLVSLEFLPPNPRHRPRDLARWLAFFDLRNYFQPMGRPRVALDLLRRILFPGRSARSVSEGWSRRHAWFAGIDGTARLEGLRRFYDANAERIQRAIRRDTPLRELTGPDDAARHRDGAEAVGEPRPVADRGTVPVTVFAGRCPQCGTEHAVLRFAPLPELTRADAGVAGANWQGLICDVEREPGVECGGRVRLQEQAPGAGSQADASMPRRYRLQIPPGGVTVRGERLLAGPAEVFDEGLARDLVRAGAEVVATLSWSHATRRWSSTEPVLPDNPRGFVNGGGPRDPELKA